MPQSLVRIYVDDNLKKTALVNLTGSHGETFLQVYMREESSPKVELRAVYLVGNNAAGEKARLEVNINSSTSMCFDNPAFPRAQPCIEMHASTVVPAAPSLQASSLLDNISSQSLSQFNPSAAMPGAFAPTSKLCVFQFGIKIYDCRLDHFCGSVSLYQDIQRRAEQSNTFWSQKFSQEVYETRCPPLEDLTAGLSSENAVIICVHPTLEIHSSVMMHLDTCGLQASAPVADGTDKAMQYILFRRSPFLLDDLVRYIKRYDKSTERREMLERNCMFMVVFKPPSSGMMMGASNGISLVGGMNSHLAPSAAPPPQSLQSNPSLAMPGMYDTSSYGMPAAPSQGIMAPQYSMQAAASMPGMGYPGAPPQGYHQQPGMPQPHAQLYQPSNPNPYDPNAAAYGAPTYPYSAATSVGGQQSFANPPLPPPQDPNIITNIPQALGKLAELIRIEGGKLHSKVVGRAFRNYHIDAAEFIENAVRSSQPASLTSLLGKYPECGIRRDTIEKLFHLVIDMSSDIGRVVQPAPPPPPPSVGASSGRESRFAQVSSHPGMMPVGQSNPYAPPQAHLGMPGMPGMPFGHGQAGLAAPMGHFGQAVGAVGQVSTISGEPTVPSHYMVGGPNGRSGAILSAREAQVITAQQQRPGALSDDSNRYGPGGSERDRGGRDRRGTSRSRSRSRERRERERNRGGRDRDRDRDRDRGRDRDASRSRERRERERNRSRRGGDRDRSNSSDRVTRGRDRGRDRDRGRGDKGDKSGAPGSICPQFTSGGFCLWGRRCNMVHPPEFQRKDITKPTTKQLDDAIGMLARYLYHQGAPEGTFKAMVYEKVYDMFRQTHPDHHKTLDDYVLSDPNIENVGSAIVSREFSRHMLSFRKGRKDDGELGATRSVLLVDVSIIHSKP